VSFSTAGHKTCHFVFDITLAFLGRFLYFCTTGNRNEYSAEELKNYHFILTVSPDLPVKNKNDIKTADFEVNHRSAFDQTGCSQLSQKESHPCSSFPIVRRIFFYQSYLRKSLIFIQVFDKKLRPIFKLNVFNFKK